MVVRFHSLSCSVCYIWELLEGTGAFIVGHVDFSFVTDARTLKMSLTNQLILFEWFSNVVQLLILNIENRLR